MPRLPEKLCRDPRASEEEADRATREQGPHRQPRRDRRPGRPGLPRRRADRVAVYADPDRDALHVRMADEAYRARRVDPGRVRTSRIDKLLDVAAPLRRRRVHPGYGFLSENADFAQAVHRRRADLDRPDTAVDPRPRRQGDRPAHRRSGPARRWSRAPPSRCPGPTRWSSSPQEHGLPVAIKAAFGGGGRGLKVARTMDEIPDLFESAVREAVTAFGRGECFVERYLDQPRHVEAQVLADTHGNVIVVGTRDCSLQRRYQKLVEEAPAPFLTDEQRATIHESAKAICREAGYHGAGTVEFLVGEDGTISFLEVNTRLQVEHPVSEETSRDRPGARAVPHRRRREAALHRDPTPRGHSIEFRINGEDPGRKFLPAPGTVTSSSRRPARACGSTPASRRAR